MSREHDFLMMLEATSRIHFDISKILEAKAVEAEKIRNWTLNLINSNSLISHEKQLHESLQIHGQIVELIHGLTKVEKGMNNNLKAVLNVGDVGEESGDLNGFFGSGDDQGDLGL
ncbi:hypothetical protein [Paenibacillus crassostreae]|uniref:Restriction endonuclease subunit S n=1 Tax=Paenibacillus crassostreae TaxID=1763538 RepID=A0A167GGI0_9BACL|nr:hypothetical protein [Paenibacillus crassostreae]AOZ91965.1 hypothetical protein LPB68_06855 [Paenibacillus crassostreae]OAB77551.1 hypothetical protein PNBC_01595 [Paenibacillus crassostreae]